LPNSFILQPTRLEFIGEAYADILGVASTVAITVLFCIALFGLKYPPTNRIVPTLIADIRLAPTLMLYLEGITL